MYCTALIRGAPRDWFNENRGYEACRHLAPDRALVRALAKRGHDHVRAEVLQHLQPVCVRSSVESGSTPA